MRDRLIIVLVLALLLSFTLSPASAHACEAHVWNADVIKGLEDVVIVRAFARDGCNRYYYINYVGADEDQQDTTWQYEECLRIGILDVQNFYKHKWDKDIDPQQIKVSCTPY